MKEHLIAVDAPHFYAGLVVQNGRVVETAPILHWAIGRDCDSLGAYFRRKRWKVIIVSEREIS